MLVGLLSGPEDILALSHWLQTQSGVLLEEFLVPLGLTQRELAARIQVSYPRVNELVHGKRGLTPDTAPRLSRLLGIAPEFWLNLQLAYDSWQAMHAKEA